MMRLSIYFLFLIVIFFSCKKEITIKECFEKKIIEDSVVVLDIPDGLTIVSDSVCCFTLSSGSKIVFSNFYTGKILRIIDYKNIYSMKTWAYLITKKDTLDEQYNECYNLYMKEGKNGLRFTVEAIQKIDKKIVVTHYFDDAEKMVIKQGVNNAPDTTWAPVQTHKIATCINAQSYKIDSFFILNLKSYEEDAFYPFISANNCLWDVSHQTFYSTKFTPINLRRNNVCCFRGYDWSKELIFDKIFSDTSTISFPGLVINNSTFSTKNNEVYVSSGNKIYKLPSQELIVDVLKIAKDIFFISKFSILDNERILVEYRTYKMEDGYRKKYLCIINVNENKVERSIAFDKHTTYTLINLNQLLTIHQREDGYYFQMYCF